MESIVGIFNSFADAKRASAILRTLGIPDNRITVLSPHTTEAELEAHVEDAAAGEQAEEHQHRGHAAQMRPGVQAGVRGGHPDRPAEQGADRPHAVQPGHHWPAEPLLQQ